MDTLLLLEKERIKNSLSTFTRDLNIPEIKSDMLEIELDKLDQNNKNFINIFNKMCNTEFISENRAKILVEKLYPTTLPYRGSLNWCSYLALLLKGYNFVGVSSMVKIFKDKYLIEKILY